MFDRTVTPHTKGTVIMKCAHKGTNVRLEVSRSDWAPASITPPPPAATYHKAKPEILIIPYIFYFISNIRRPFEFCIVKLTVVMDPGIEA
jgi:hypothetical protein